MYLKKQDKQHEIYWVGKLSDITQEQSLKSVLPVQTPLRQKKEDTGRAGVVFSPELSEKIRTICNNSALHITGFFLNSLNILRWHYTGKDDLVTFVTLSGIHPGKPAGVYHWFSRHQLPPAANFKKALSQLAGELVDHFSHTPADMVAIKNKLLHNYGIDDAVLYSVGLGYPMTDAPPDSCELFFALQETEGNFHLSLIDGKKTFPHTILKSIVTHLLNLIQACIQSPETPIPEFPVISQDEQHRIEKYNEGARRDYPHYPNIISPFITIAGGLPDAVAVVCEEDRITYRQLDQLSNRLARFLSEGRQVKKGELVGLMVDRNIDMVTALIGILKAQAAFVPIDPQMPPERIRYIMDNTGLQILITQEKYKETISHFTGSMILMDKKEEWLTISADPLPLTFDATSLAYVIYTSGSTGNPKGVMIRHEGFVNMMNWYIEEYAINPEERMLIITSHSFDLTLKNIFAPLSVGGQVHLLRQKDFDPVYINDLIRKEEITFINCTPFNFYPLVDRAFDRNYADKLRSLRVLILGGEAINTENLKEWMEDPRFNTSFVNTYGCTECSDIASSYTVTNWSSFFTQQVPAGTPIYNTGIYILDERLAYTPLGFIGELFNSGIGVGAGYWKNPTLSTERFIPNPYKSGDVLYRTGDLVRYTEEGLIEFVNRKDFQVKIRGNRVEVPEIEHRLLQYPGLQKVVVIPRTDERKYIFLAAYLISDNPIIASELREFMLKYLPDYMVPSYFIRVDHFPLNENGKLDRKKLPDPAKLLPGDEQDALPASRTEEKVMAVWKDIFPVEKIGMLDNFFTVGGNSLKAVQLSAGIEKAFGRRLSIADLFNNPTIREQALLLKPVNGTRSSRNIPLIPTADYYPLSNAQKRIWVEDQLEEGKNISYNIHTVAIIDRPIDTALLRRCIGTLMERHEILRTSFHFIKDNPVQQVHEKGEYDFYEVDLVKVRQLYTRAAGFIRELIETPFDLTRPRLLRVSLLRVAPQKCVLAIVLHHIISDGWSLTVLMKELQSVYDAFEKEMPHGLPSPGLQYKDFAAWHNNLLQTEDIRAQRQFWHEQLSGRLASGLIPPDYPRPAGRSYKAGSVSYVLTQKLTDALQHLSIEKKVSPFIILSAAIKVLLYARSGSRDIITGSPSFGRDNPQLATSVGMFLNMLVLRDRLSPEDTFTRVIDKVKDTVLESSRNQDYPFDFLAEELLPDRDRAHNPFFDILITYNDFVIHRPVVKGEKNLRKLAYGNDLLKYDLAFIFTGEKKIRVEIFYNPDLYNAGTISRLNLDLVKVFEMGLLKGETPIAHIASTIDSRDQVILMQAIL